MLTKTFSPRKLAWFLLIGPLALFPSSVLAVDAGASSATLFVAEDASTTSLDLSTEVTGDDPEIFSVGLAGLAPSQLRVMKKLAMHRPPIFTGPNTSPMT